MTDTLTINDFRVDASIGVHSWEKRVLQQLVFKLEMVVDTSRAVDSDNLGDALDYQMICELLRSETTSQHHNLLESLAFMLAEKLDAIEGVLGLKLTITKPAAVANSSGISIETTRGLLDG
jgi:dihydroneopterin aldolase